MLIALQRVTSMRRGAPIAPLLRRIGCAVSRKWRADAQTGRVYRVSRAGGGA